MVKKYLNRFVSVLVVVVTVLSTSMFAYAGGDVLPQNYIGPFGQDKIAFEVEYIGNTDLPLGHNKVIETGKYGKKELWINSNDSSDMVWKVVENAKKQIVHVGTMPTKTTTYDSYSTRYIPDSSVDAGITEELQKGVLGTTTTTKYYDVNSITGEVYTKEEKKVTVKKEDRIYRVGTKPVERIKDVDFETEYIEDVTMNKGEYKLEKEGVKGKAGYVINFTLDQMTGEVTQNIEYINIMPQNQVIRRGVFEGKINKKSSNDNQTEGNKSSFEKKSLNGEAPKTGDNVQILIYGLVTLIFVFAILILLMLRRNRIKA